MKGQRKYGTLKKSQLLICKLRLQDSDLYSKRGNGSKTTTTYTK